MLGAQDLKEKSLMFYYIVEPTSAIGSPGADAQGHDQTTHYSKRIHTNPGTKDIV